ncbi:hypothetical protein Btru_067559 [Bulinus truncatus]|nr:hypothetical protein Btru_067559 [Bulinus truncatus]
MLWAQGTALHRCYGHKEQAYTDVMGTRNRLTQMLWAQGTDLNRCYGHKEQTQMLWAQGTDLHRCYGHKEQAYTDVMGTRNSLTQLLWTQGTDLHRCYGHKEQTYTDVMGTRNRLTQMLWTQGTDLHRCYGHKEQTYTDVMDTRNRLTQMLWAQGTDLHRCLWLLTKAYVTALTISDVIGMRAGCLVAPFKIRCSGLRFTTQCEAKEVSVLRRSSKATLLITVQDGLTAEKPAGPLLVIVIAMASILFVVVVSLVTGWLLWRVKYKKSQVHPEVMTATQGTQSRTDNSVMLSPFVSPERESINLMSTKCFTQDDDIRMQHQGTTHPQKSTELSRQKSKPLYFDTADVHVADTSEFVQIVDCDDSQETEYAEVDIIFTSPSSLTTAEYNQDFIQPNQTSLKGSPTSHGVRFNYYIPPDIDHRVTSDVSECTLVPRSYSHSSRPLPVPTDTTAQTLIMEEYPYATVKKVKPGLKNRMSEIFSSEAPDNGISYLTSPRGPTDQYDASIDVYDATRDYQELEVCFGPFTDISRASLVSGRSVTTSELMLNPKNSLYWTIVEEQEDFA